MSIASASRTIKWISKSGTFTAMLLSPNGDLFQEYSGETGVTPGKIVPDWSNENNQPVLNMIISSTRVLDGSIIVSDGDVEWYCNDTKINFSGGVSSNFGGAFQNMGVVNSRPQLKVIKNVVETFGYASAVIRCVVNITVDGITDAIQASYTITIRKSSGEQYRANIIAGDNNSFVISTKDGSCRLKACLYQGGQDVTEATSGLTYQWYKLQDASWSPLSVQTGRELTVQASDVATYGEFRVIISKDGNELVSDVQGVMDVTDPYEIYVSVVNSHGTESEKIVEGETDSWVQYTPEVRERGGSSAIEGVNFDFVVLDAGGAQMSNPALGVSSYKVTYAHLLQAGGDVTVIIEANKA